MERMIRKEKAVPASLREVWGAWTTREGVQTFCAPDANIELAIGGPFEMLFDFDGPAGLRGSEGCKMLSYLPDVMLSFSWNAPPQYPTVRGQHTWVVVQLEAGPANTTLVRLAHLGWKDGNEWDQVFEYFNRAWSLVLARLAHRFSHGPIDWANPYRPASI